MEIIENLDSGNTRDKKVFGIALALVLIGLVVMGFIASYANAIPTKPDKLGIAIQKMDRVEEESRDVYAGPNTNMEIIMNVLDTHADVFRLMIQDSMDKTDQIYNLRLENNQMRQDMARIKEFINYDPDYNPHYQEVNSE